MAELYEQPDWYGLSPRKKVYSPTAIGIATTLAGPLASGYLFAENYKAFDKPGKARLSWFVSIIACFIIYSILILIPPGKVAPVYFSPLLYGSIALMLAKYYQGEKIERYIRAGGELHSHLNILLVIIRFAILATILFLLVFIFFKFLGIGTQGIPPPPQETGPRHWEGRRRLDH